MPIDAPSHQFLDTIREAESAVDSRYAMLGRVLHLPWHLSAYVLSSLACARLRQEQTRLVANFSSSAAAEVHNEVRSTLEGLHFALRVQPRPDVPVSGEINPEVHERGLSRQTAGAAMAVLDEAKAYALVRDGFIALHQGSFTASIVDGRTIRFDLDPTWKGGHRHTATTELRHDAELARMRRISRKLKLEEVKRLLAQSVELPRDIPMGGIDSGKFIDVHFHLTSFLAAHDPDPAPVMSRDQLVALISGCNGIGHAEAARYLELVTYDPKGKAHIDTFCCPVVRLTELSYVLLVPAHFYSNLRYTIPKLVVHRGPGLDAYSEKMESYVTDGLLQKYQRDNVVCRTRLAYKGPDDQGDIDFVLYDPGVASLVVAQVKAFVPPDSVVDVANANEKLAEGIVQAERVQHWFTTGGADSLFSMLGAKRPDPLGKVVFAVIGNAFEGSDCLSVPEGITLLGSDALLRTARDSISMFDAIEERTRAIQEKAEAQSVRTEYTAVELADWRFELPFRWSAG
jgi:hypothetical protein